MMMWTAEGQIVDVNPTLLAMHGYSRDEVLGREPSDFIPPETTETFHAPWPRSVPAGPSGWKRCRCARTEPTFSSRCTARR